MRTFDSLSSRNFFTEGILMIKMAKDWLGQNKGKADWIGLRVHNECGKVSRVSNEKREELSLYKDQGFMMEVLKDDFLVYVARPMCTAEKLDEALAFALRKIEAGSAYRLHSFPKEWRPDNQGMFETQTKSPLSNLSFKDLEDFGIGLSQGLKASDLVVSRSVGLWLSEVDQVLLSTSGREIQQKFSYMLLDGRAVAHKDGESQIRSINGGMANAYQGGSEVLFEKDWLDQARLAGEQAVELLSAEECPTGSMDVVLSPDQMMLQIHESIGHPLELDRILGDERNYAGWSFVKPEDFGQLQYGSEIMNVSFDPLSDPSQLASYQYDDSGVAAEKSYLIRKGKLERGLGSLESQSRSELKGVANSRSSSWNRPSMDRMANINLEPGDTPFSEMIAQVEKGVWMTSNRSWSIDDYRNKFQFGCEYAKSIENGKIGKTLKNPNYRGVTNEFWKKLKAVGSKETYRQFGTPFCGKGEPNQVIRVSHGSPMCLFSGISVFGGG